MKKKQMILRLSLISLMLNLTNPSLAASPSPTPSLSPRPTCKDVLKLAQDVIAAKNNVIKDYKQVSAEQEQQNFELKQENKEMNNELARNRVFTSVGIFGSLLLGILAGGFLTKHF